MHNDVRDYIPLCRFKSLQTLPSSLLSLRSQSHRAPLEGPARLAIDWALRRAWFLELANKTCDTQANSHFSNVAEMAWNPCASILGDMPLVANEIKEYPVPKEIQQASPTQLLVYTFITLEEAMPGFQRGYYEIYTKKKNGGPQFTFYMNVAMTNDAVLNSENMWLPYGPDFVESVFVRLNGVEGTEMKPKKKKVKGCRGKDAATVLKEHAGHCHDDDEGVQVGQVMLTGYRV